jgi:LCP family protein required for cell wall assembly
MTKPYMPSPDEYLRSLESQPTPKTPKKVPGPHRNWKRAVKWLFLSLLLALAAMLAFIIFNLLRLSINPFDLGPLQGAEAGRVNILVLGVGDPGHAGAKLADTNMVISLNTETKQVAMIGIPRDLRVSIPGYGLRKINEAHALGGPELAQETVARMLDIPIDHYVLTDFSGLKELVNAVGGIEVNVKERLYDPEYPCESNQYKACGIDIKPGLQQMDGATALQYSRCRKGTCGNDFGRAERQQEVIQLVQAKVFSNETYFNPARWTLLSAVAGSYIKSDMSVTKLIQAGWQINGSQKTINLVLSTEPGGLLVNGGGSDLRPASGSFIQIQKRVQNIFAE